MPKRLTLLGLAVAAVALLILYLASRGDAVGFSSNRDFYFSVRHPVRAGILVACLWAGLGVALIAGLLWLRQVRQR